MSRATIPARRSAGFTIVELMVSLAVLMILSLLLIAMSDQTARVWRSTTGKLEPFRDARAAFEAMTTRLSQATLNVYWDYDSAAAPTKYQRRSELRFIAGPSEMIFDGADEPVRPTHSVFFAAPLGVTEDARYRGFENLLCTWGYFLEYGDDSALRPPFITDKIVPLRHRSRLKELWQPAEKNTIYSYTSAQAAADANRTRLYAGRDWFQRSLAEPRPPTHVLAENIVALLITPRLSQADEAEVRRTEVEVAAEHSPLAPDFFYDSAPPAAGSTDTRYQDPRLNPVHQLPPVLQVTIVAIDEASAEKLALTADTPDPFGIASKFRQSADLSKDLLAAPDRPYSLESTLIARRASYRIFSTNVVVRAAKWSREQTN